MPKVVRFHETGGPEVLKFEDVPPAATRQRRGSVEGASDRIEPRRVDRFITDAMSIHRSCRRGLGTKQPEWWRPSDPGGPQLDG